MKLCWIDIETTGLDPVNDYLLELALIVTDEDLNVLEEREWVIEPSHTRPDGMLSWPTGEEFEDRLNDWVRKTHTESGLLKEARMAGDDRREVEEEVLDVIAAHWGRSRPLLAGSSPHFDRGFLATQLPKVDKALHYRHFDTSVLERAFEAWRPDLKKPRDGRVIAHRALDDIRWSVECARHYRGVIRALKAPEFAP